MELKYRGQDKKATIYIHGLVAQYPIDTAVRLNRVLSLGIILYEIFGRNGPYGGTLLNPDEIIFRVQNPEPGFEYMRPDLEMLKDTERECECPDYVTGE